MDSILISIKKLLGITEEYKQFDPDIIIHINSVFLTLKQLGVGPEKAFAITGEYETWDQFLPEDNPNFEAVKSYMHIKVKLLFDPPTSSAVIEAMKTGRFLYVAHPDIMNYNGQDCVYEWEMTRLCKAAKEMHIPLEINMIGMKEKKQYPSKRFFQIAAEVGCDIIIGLDAHTIEHITDVETYKECVDFARRLNLHLIDGSDLL